jgi:ribosome biogenesis GTPase
MTGRIIQTTGSWYHVKTGADILSARLKGKFKLDERDTTNPIAVGDWVTLEGAENSTELVISEIHPRKNYIVRQSPRHKHQRHIIASNIDQAIVVATISQPRTSVGFIDRFIAAAECYHIPVKVIVNKIDLLREKDKLKLEEWKEIYSHIGYELIPVCAMNGDDIKLLRDLIQDKTTLIAGHSGVGKSTLLNQVNPELNLKTGAISSKWEKGMHTTTFATMHEVLPDSYIIDTPGIKEFALLHIEPEELSGYFVEMRELVGKCQYNNCKHINEPNCAVINAVEQGEIALSRYESYLGILDNIESKNYWERK